MQMIFSHRVSFGLPAGHPLAPRKTVANQEAITDNKTPAGPGRRPHRRRRRHALAAAIDEGIANRLANRSAAKPQQTKFKRGPKGRH